MPRPEPHRNGVLKLKALIRKAVARTYDQLWAAVGQIGGLFSDEKWYNYFTVAGYEAN